MLVQLIRKIWRCLEIVFGPEATYTRTGEQQGAVSPPVPLDLRRRRRTLHADRAKVEAMKQQAVDWEDADFLAYVRDRERELDELQEELDRQEYMASDDMAGGA